MGALQRVPVYHWVRFQVRCDPRCDFVVERANHKFFEGVHAGLELCPRCLVQSNLTQRTFFKGNLTQNIWVQGILTQEKAKLQKFDPMVNEAKAFWSKVN